jgi:hypothetical protein
MSDLDNKFKMKVDMLELSIRTGNCLKSANINYIGELVQKNESELMRLENFGRKSLNEVKEVLETMDLSLGMTLPHVRKICLHDVHKQLDEFEIVVNLFNARLAKFRRFIHDIKYALKND